MILRTDADDATVRVSVVDYGVGLTDEQLPRMFEPFYTTKPDGMGLGLAICQTIMNAHDGTVAVQRNVERGTTFSFSLPALPPDTTAVPPWLEIGSGCRAEETEIAVFHHGGTERTETHGGCHARTAHGGRMADVRSAVRSRAAQRDCCTARSAVE